MATVRDVAKLSGVSPATVSHVLHNRSNISPQTRQRVLHAVRALGYKPGTVPISRVGRRSTQTLGVFAWLEPGYPLRDNPYATEILDGILAVSLPRDWNITLFNVTAWDDAASKLRHLADGRCDGFLVLAPPPSVGIPHALRERGYPFVMINSGSYDPAVNSVDIDNRAATRELTHYLAAQGHRHIAFLPGADGYENTGERLQGFLEAAREASLPDPTPWILRPGTYDFEQSKQRLRDALTRRQALPPGERPTAFICGNDKLATGAAEVLAEQGLTVPGDISLVGFDDSVYATRMTPLLTTVRQPLNELGKRATQILLDGFASDQQPNAPISPVTKEYLPHQIVYRDSVRQLQENEL